MHIMQSEDDLRRQAVRRVRSERKLADKVEKVSNTLTYLLMAKPMTQPSDLDDIAELVALADVEEELEKFEELMKISPH